MRISDWSSDVCSSDLKGPLFRTIARSTKRLSDTPLPQANAFAMVRRRAAAAGIGTAIGNHSFRATGITTYLKNGGTLETAATMANHKIGRASSRDSVCSYVLILGVAVIVKKINIDQLIKHEKSTKKINN